MGLLITWVALSVATATAQVLCPEPTDGRPRLSFTLAGIHPGDYRRRCQPMLEEAARSGFTSVTLVPTYLYRRGPPDRIDADAGMPASEVQACLEQAEALGFHVVYQPHVDDISILDGSSERIWRANLDVHPNEEYMRTLFGPVLLWMARRHPRVGIDLVVSGELERSTANYPDEWLRFTERLRTTIPRSLRTQTRLAFNPNWRPNEHIPPENCESFRAFLRSLDFVAPSFYGDWSSAVPLEATSAAVETVYENEVRMLTRETGEVDCALPEMRDLPFAVGEFGIAGDPRAIQRWAPLATPTDLEDRYRVFERLLNWARSSSSARQASGLPLSLWTLGIHDPIGLEPSDAAVPDPRIVGLLRSYTADACGLRPRACTSETSAPAVPLEISDILALIEL